MVNHAPRGHQPRSNPFFYIIGILVIVAAILAFLYANGMFRGLTSDATDSAAPETTAPATGTEPAPADATNP